MFIPWWCCGGFETVRRFLESKTMPFAFNSHQLPNVYVTIPWRPRHVHCNSRQPPNVYVNFHKDHACKAATLIRSFNPTKLSYRSRSRLLFRSRSRLFFWSHSRFLSRRHGWSSLTLRRYGPQGLPNGLEDLGCCIPKPACASNFVDFRSQVSGVNCFIVSYGKEHNAEINDLPALRMLIASATSSFDIRLSISAIAK